MLLSRNIVLPSYQRCFVWKQNQVENFINSLKGDVFIPPVIIGALQKSDGSVEKMILDGQQRLSSILLAYLGWYPKSDAFKRQVEPRYKDVENPLGEESEPEEEAVDWTIKLLFHNDKPRADKDDIVMHSNPAQYIQLAGDFILDEQFLKTHYLGFSFIVPINESDVAQQKFYSTVFREINYQGVVLQGPESRKSLYFLDVELDRLFEPECVQRIRIGKTGSLRTFDFVRILSFLSQYKKKDGVGTVAAKCYNQDQLEVYYCDYIDRVINDTNSSRFGQFSAQIGKSNIDVRLSMLDTCIQGLGLAMTYDSIIEADMFMIGLVYITMFEGKTLLPADYDSIKSNIQAKLEELKRDPNHRNHPARLQYIRRRIKSSIDIYKAKQHDPIQP